MEAFIILQRMLMLFAMMLIGFYSYKKQWIDDHSYSNLSKIVVNVTNPLLIIDGVLNKDAIESPNILVQNLILSLTYFAVLIIAGIIVSKLMRLKSTDMYLYRLMMVFSNIGFMGIPVITSLYGEGSVIYIVFYVLIYNILLYTYGIYLSQKANINENIKTETFSWKAIINVGVIACIIAIILFLLKIRVPDSVKSFTSSMGNMCIPLSMMLIGASLAKQKLRDIVGDFKMYIFLFIKLLVIPITSALILTRMDIYKDVIGVFCLIIAMPVGSIVVLFAKENGADEKLCTAGSIVSTLLSVITIPIVALFL